MLAPVAACSASSDGPTYSEPCSKAPGYAHGATLFGTSLSSSDGSLDEALALNDARFGRLPVVRQFDPSVPPENAWDRRTPLFSDRAVVASFREPPAQILSGKYDDLLLAWFRGAPEGAPIFWSYFHEPEKHIEQGRFTADEYVEAWRHLVDLAGSLCRPNLYPTLILTGWTTEQESGRDWRDYYPGDDYISVVAWDPYNSATSVPTSYVDPATLFAPMVTASEETGKPWGIAETGTQLVPGDDGHRRAAWLAATAEFFDDQGAAFVTYFQSTRDGDFKLTDPPSIAAWRAWVSESGNSLVGVTWADGAPALTDSSADIGLDLAVPSLDGGTVALDTTVPTGPVALVLPGFRDEDVVPRAVIRISNSDADDRLEPAEQAFSFGADVRLDAESFGSDVDNGDNVLQRGLSSDDALFKAELDDHRPACTVRGTNGEVKVRAEDAIAPDRWYRVLCHRTGDQVVLEVTDLEDGSRREHTESGRIGSVSFPDPSIPLSIGGKLAHNGDLIRSATDQFNGSVARPVLTIDP